MFGVAGGAVGGAGPGALVAVRVTGDTPPTVLIQVAVWRAVGGRRWAAAPLVGPLVRLAADTGVGVGAAAGQARRVALWGEGGRAGPSVRPGGPQQALCEAE